MNWTKEFPKESGWYWYREERGEPEPVEWDKDMPWVARFGSDIFVFAGPRYTDLDNTVENNGGEFGDRITFPV